MHKFTGLHITFLKEILWTNCPKMPACELGIRDNFPIFWPNPKVGKTITDKAESENYPALIGTTNIELMEKFSWHRGIYMPCEAQLPFLSWPVIGEVLSVLWTACCALNLPNNLNYSAVELTQWSLLSSTVFPLISKLARWVWSHLFFMEVKLRMPDRSLRTLHSNPNGEKQFMFMLLMHYTFQEYQLRKFCWGGGGNSSNRLLFWCHRILSARIRSLVHPVK